MPRIRLAVAMGLAAFAFAVPGASAATTVGQTFTPDVPFPGGYVLGFQSAVSGSPSHVIPSAGVITSFAHSAAASPSATLALVVLRPVGSDYQVVSVGDAKTLADSVLNNFTTRMPVNAGDLIAIFGSSSSLKLATPSMGTGNKISFSTVTPVAGATIAAASVTTIPGAIVDISAKVEADADGDGYGDETQDSCPSQKSTQGACDTAGPSLALTAAKTQKTNKGFSFSATSNETSTTTVGGNLTCAIKKNGKKVKKSIKLVPVTQSLTAGTGSTFTFTLSSKAKAALKTSGKLKAALTITSVDALGNTSTSTLSLTIKRK